MCCVGSRRGVSSKQVRPVQMSRIASSLTPYSRVRHAECAGLGTARRGEGELALEGCDGRFAGQGGSLLCAFAAIDGMCLRRFNRLVADTDIWSVVVHWCFKATKITLTQL